MTTKKPLEVIHPDGSVTFIEPTFKACQEAVGGYVEIVPLRGYAGRYLCNEDGMAQGLPLNHRASVLCDQVLLGPVVHIPAEQIAEVLDGD